MVVENCNHAWPPDFAGDHEHLCARPDCWHARHICKCGAEMWEAR